MQTNIGIVVPFVVSTKRYGILWDIYSKMTFKDDASGATLWAESAPAGVDYYFVAGDTMDGVIAGYRSLTGAAPMFPKAAFGLFMSKERYKTQDRLIEVARTFRKEGFPIDYIVQDWQYWGGDRDGTWSGMIWDQERFPDPAALTKTLHDELHMKLMNSIWPSVGNDTALAHELDAKGLRFEPLHWISKRARIYDAFSPEGRAIYFKHIKKGLLDVGVDALWMDGTEVEVGGACHDPAEVERDIKNLGRNALGDFTRYLNPYTLMTTKGTYEGQRATGDKRVFTLTRSAWAGQQRYAALPWSGDTSASWETLRRSDRRRHQRRHGRPAVLDPGYRRLLRVLPAGREESGVSGALRPLEPVRGLQSHLPHPRSQHRARALHLQDARARDLPLAPRRRCSCAMSCCPTSTRWPGRAPPTPTR